MILSGKKLLIYRLNQIKELAIMTATVIVAVSAMFYMCVVF